MRPYIFLNHYVNTTKEGALLQNLKEYFEGTCHVSGTMDLQWPIQSPGLLKEKETVLGIQAKKGWEKNYIVTFFLVVNALSRKQWSNRFKIVKDRKCEPQILYSAKLIYKYRGWREAVTNIAKTQRLLFILRVLWVLSETSTKERVSDNF